MKTVLSSLAIVIFAGLLSAEKVTLSGYLIDRECAPGIIEQGKEASANHDRSCALMDLCAQDVLDLTVTEGSYLIGSCYGGGFDAVLARAPERVQKPNRGS